MGLVWQNEKKKEKCSFIQSCILPVFCGISHNVVWYFRKNNDQAIDPSDFFGFFFFVYAGFLENGLHEGDELIGYHGYNPPHLPTFSIHSTFSSDCFFLALFHSSCV